MPSIELSFQKLTSCRLCESLAIEQVLDLGEQPLANSLLTDPDQEEGLAPLVLVRCGACSAIQLSVNVDPSTLFREYVWVTGTSNSTIKHCRWLAKQIMERVIESGGQESPNALEIASNDGTFLRELQSLGFRVLGVDPARNLAEHASAMGIQTIPEFFDTKLATRIRDHHGPQGVVIARNVLSHVPDPQELVRALSLCLTLDGIAVIEFHRADVILEELHYDSVYHEHTMFHTLKTMTSMLENANLTPFDVLPSPISGGSWILFAANTCKKVRPTKRWREAWAREMASGVWENVSWLEFASRVNEHRQTLTRSITERSDEGQVVVAYGASARSSTVLNACDLSSKQITCIADGNSLKQGKFTPGTRIPIEAPIEALARNPDVILLLAFNFKAEIEEVLHSQMWQGEIINAFPESVVIVDFP